MKKIIIGALVVGGALAANSAFAGQREDILARLDALEKENSAIRRENKALGENKSLRERNADLKASSPQPVAQTAPAVVYAEKPKGITDKMTDFFGAYAADLPVAYKAPVLQTPGQLRFWAEGGAIWSGGDPVAQNFNLADFNTLAGLGGLLGGGGGIPRQFDLTPKIGWEAATGFDYRFPNSAWHVSGQFRYGEGGKTNGSASSTGGLNVGAALPGVPLPAQLAGINIAGSNNVAVSYREQHWLADMSVGYELSSGGPATAYSSASPTLQIKGGIRTEEFVSRLNTSNNLNVSVSIPPPAIPVIGNQISLATSTSTDNRTSFLGAGPLIGIEGSIPFFGNWTFDYAGDAAVLFGTQQSTVTTSTSATVTPALLALLLGGGGNGIATATAERFGTALSTDVQAGFGYWVTPNIKVAASYRLDALINVQNQRAAAVANITPDRYTHGPRLTITGRF